MSQTVPTHVADMHLNAAIAGKVIGLSVYGLSHHKPGTRPLPHAWTWRRVKGCKLMIFDGKVNREFNALAHEHDARQACRAGIQASLIPPTADLTTPEGRRALCEAFQEQTRADPKPPTFAQWLAGKGISMAGLSPRVMAVLQDEHAQETSAAAPAATALQQAAPQT